MGFGNRTGEQWHLFQGNRGKKANFRGVQGNRYNIREHSRPG